MTARTAIVQEWISSMAGSEQVFERLAQIWPSADLYALSREPSVPIDLGARTLETTFLDRAGLRNRRGMTLPLMPFAWRALGSRDYDLVISSHHAFAASNRLTRTGVTLAYVHSPARYLWTPDIDERGSHPGLAPARHLLRSYDRRAAQRLTGVAANSLEVARRIERFWDREARIIHPPVDTAYFSVEDAATEVAVPAHFLLGMGRWIPYKNPGMIIRVAEKLGWPAVIAGSGPLASQLRSMAAEADVPVHLIEAPSRPAVRALLQRAAALLFPTHEDFGMIPVEAMAAGTPVVALARGGALETVADGVSGFLVQDDHVQAYADAVKAAGGIRASDCRRQAEDFSASVFRSRMLEWVDEYT